MAVVEVSAMCRPVGDFGLTLGRDVSQSAAAEPRHHMYVQRYVNRR